MCLIPRLALLALSALLAFGAAGCASYEMVEIPGRQADLYPFSHRKAGISLAVDDLAKPRRARRYFGEDLSEYGILPLEIIVSNHGSARISVGPSDVLLLRGPEIVDPLPVETVADIVKDRGLWLTSGTAEQVDRFLEDLSFQESVLAPGESYHGVVFFDATPEPRRSSRFFRVLSAYPQARLKVHLAVTDLERNTRIPFGPFGIYR